MLITSIPHPAPLSLDSWLFVLSVCVRCWVFFLVFVLALRCPCPFFTSFIVVFLLCLFFSSFFFFFSQNQGGDRCVFDKFLVTNSIPTTTDKLPRDDVYVVLDLVDRIKNDLDLHSSI